MKFIANERGIDTQGHLYLRNINISVDIQHFEADTHEMHSRGKI